MARRLRSRVEEAGRRAEVVEAAAERLPFEDGRFDTAAVTLVLCTVRDPARALEEIARVLKPGGQLLFLEHVRASDGPRLAGWQDRLERPWGWVAGGCHPNRDTIASSGGLAAQCGIGAARRDAEGAAARSRWSPARPSATAPSGSRAQAIS